GRQGRRQPRGLPQAVLWDNARVTGGLRPRAEHRPPRLRRRGPARRAGSGLIRAAVALVLVALAGCGGAKHRPAPATAPLARALAYVSPQAQGVAVLATDTNHGQG